MSRDTARIRDQLGKNPETFPVLNANFDELIETSEGPLIAQKEQIGNSWIVGSSTNGIVGANTNTFAGGQQVVGASENYVRYAAVANTNNVFVEEFDHDVTSNTDETDATGWGDGDIDFTTGQIAVSNPIYFGTELLLNATILLIEGTNTGNLSFELSTDGVIWVSATANTIKSFTNKERALYWKATASGSATLTRLVISYETDTVKETQLIVDESDNNLVDESGNNVAGLVAA